ncbi:TPA: hypothetical protein EYM26_10750 [Candidatus Poribacteria bacterium]|nr:hypothetical protein [Candidatus Poribacteria bacterium]
MNHLAKKHFSQASICYKQRNYSEAVDYYLVGLSIEPECVEAYADLAKSYEMLACWDQALQAIEQALRLRPSDPTSLRRKNRITEENSFYNIPYDVISSPLEDSRYFDLNVSPDISTLSDDLVQKISGILERTCNFVGYRLNFFPPDPVKVYIEEKHLAKSSYNDLDTFPDWAPAYYDGTIRIRCCNYSMSGLGVLQTLIRHEWTHLLVDLITDGKCPTWIDEGLAMSIARQMFSFEMEYLQTANRNGAILRLQQLNKPFSQIDDRQRRLAYYQAHAIFLDLIEQFGFSSICVLLGLIGSGEKPEDAIQQTFGKPTVQIFSDWQRKIDMG